MSSAPFDSKLKEQRNSVYVAFLLSFKMTLQGSFSCHVSSEKGEERVRRRGEVTCPR